VIQSTLVPILANRLPEFVKDLYPNFEQFIRDYLTWLEQDENFLRILEDWRSNNEVTLQVEPYIDAILVDLGFVYNQPLAIDKKLLVHVLRDFYMSRGSEGSLKTLFKILYGKDGEVEIRYPRDEMLIPSYAEYGKRFFMFSTATSLDTDDFNAIAANIIHAGGTVTGGVSGTTAFIEDIQIVFGQGQTYFKIEILEPTSAFLNGEQLTIACKGIEVVETLKPSVAIEIDDGGSGYAPTDTIGINGTKLYGSVRIDSLSRGGVDGLNITTLGTGYAIGDRISASIESGFGFTAYVTTINLSGGITGYQIQSKGYNYTQLPLISVKSTGGTGAVIAATSTEIGSVRRISFDAPFVDFTIAIADVSSATGSGAELTIVPQPIWSISDWANRRGFLEENSTLIDSDKYQQFSYTVVSQKPASEYEKFLDEWIHPAGYIRISSFELQDDLNFNLLPGDSELSNQISKIYESTLTLALALEFQIA
jgi:hypothetical protein